MIRSVKIEGYRCFEHLEMSALGRVNLLVGKNNSGKTSVLEALHILSSNGDTLALWEHCGRRGERLSEARDPRYVDDEIDISHLFTGHDLQVGSSFTISAENESPRQWVTFTIAEPTPKERSEPSSTEEKSVVGPRLVLHVRSFPRIEVSRSIPLSRRGGLSSDAIDAPPRRVGRRSRGEPSNVRYISTESLTSEQLVELWDKIALTPQEDWVISALRFLDPKIERLASVGISRYFYNDRGGFKVRREGHSTPLPIGSMGDGTWRMLAMAIAITQCQGGVLLIDEIDTGLHHTVMTEMWKFMYRIAQAFDVQIFATTHSYDCVYSLGSICQPDVRFESQVTLQRIEAGRKKAISFTESEIRVAAEKHVETR